MKSCCHYLLIAPELFQVLLPTLHVEFALSLSSVQLHLRTDFHLWQVTLLGKPWMTFFGSAWRWCPRVAAFAPGCGPPPVGGLTTSPHTSLHRSLPQTLGLDLCMWSPLCQKHSSWHGLPALELFSVWFWPQFLNPWACHEHCRGPHSALHSPLPSTWLHHTIHITTLKERLEPFLQAGSAVYRPCPSIGLVHCGCPHDDLVNERREKMWVVQCYHVCKLM